MRRLTELDLAALPAVGSIARGTPAVIERPRRRALPALRPAGARPLRRRGRARHGGGARPVKDIFRVRRMWRPRSELKKRYDVVIIGGGSHGLATAYYLAKNHGITERRGARAVATSARAPSGRNTTIIRSNYRTPEGAAFYRRSVKLYERLSRRPRLQPDVLAAGPPHARALRPRDQRRCSERAEVNQLLGIDSPRRRARRDREALPAARPLRPPDVADHGRALPPARRDHPPRRGRLGLRARRRPRRRRDPPVHRGDRDRAPNGRVTGVADEPRRHRRRTPSSARRPAGRRSSATSPACGCRSRRTSCRRS